MDPKETFLQIYDEAIVREGADKLRAYLLRSDFFEAPASIRYHSNHAGGLCAHSVNVYRRLLERMRKERADAYAHVGPENFSGIEVFSNENVAVTLSDHPVMGFVEINVGIDAAGL